MIRKNKQKQWLKNKNNIFYFLNKHTFPSLYHMIKGNYLKNIKKQQVVIYMTMITICKALISAFYLVGFCPTSINNN